MDRPNIDLLALRGFCALMEQRSVSHAAFRLGVTQPKMSHLLAKLRKYFDDPLLVWSGGHMVPTPRALPLEVEIRQMLSGLDRVSSPTQPFDPSSSETIVRLGATEYLEILLLAKAMTMIEAQAPGLRIEIRPPDRFRDSIMLEKGETDFLVGWNPTPAPSLRSRHLFTDKLVCIARRDHPNLRGDQLSYKKYIELPQVQFDGPGRAMTARILQERLAKDKHQLTVKVVVQSLFTVAEVVANSNLVATLSKRFVTSFLKQYPLKFMELPISLPPMQIRVFWHERMQSDPRSRWFRNLLADIVKNM